MSGLIDLSDAAKREHRQAPLSFDYQSVFKANRLSELPVGRGELPGRGVPHWMDRIIGRWELGSHYHYAVRRAAHLHGAEDHQHDRRHDVSTERFNFQLRGTASDATNTPIVLNPIVNINDPNFRRITGTSTAAAAPGNRILVLQGRLNF